MNAIQGMGRRAKAALAAHGGKTEVFCDEELITLSGTTTNSTVPIPDGAIVLAVSNRSSGDHRRNVLQLRRFGKRDVVRVVARDQAWRDKSRPHRTCAHLRQHARPLHGRRRQFHRRPSAEVQSIT